MFGNKLKTWMENYIGRPRKKDVQKEKSKANVPLESSESLAYSDAGISSGSQQVLSSSGSDNKEGYSTTTMESEKSGMTHCHTIVSLPSPESAYSTGYSTDGASPGGTGPPEYYINIRTGKHYFPSPAPTPTSPQPKASFLPHHPANHRFSGPFHTGDFPRSINPPGLSRIQWKPSLSESSHDRTFTAFPDGFHPQLGGVPSEVQVQTTLSASVPSYSDNLNPSKSPTKKSFPISQLTPIKLFLKSPKSEKGKTKQEPDKTPVFENKKKVSSAGKSKKWFKQPFQKFGHRRTDSCEGSAGKNESKREIHLENLRYMLGQENSASPRQRNRIKTNPWLPTEPLSSQNFHTLRNGFSPSLARNRSCSNTPLQNRKANQADSLQSHPNQMNEKCEEYKDHWNKYEKTSTIRAGGKFSGMESSDHSDEDLTLNEVMGTYNESYFYEKETDILSDSDPTDCEDYVTDSEANNGGDERDSHDDELDFIDKGSVSESDENFPQNTGKCTYHDSRSKRNSFLWKNDRRHFRRDSESKRLARKDQDSKGRREKRRHSKKSLGQENEEKGKPKAEINENVGGLNLSRVLVQRMMEKCSSKGTESTPVGARRQKSTSESRETQTSARKEKAEGRKSGILEGLTMIDLEADNRYNELIKEAENIIESLRNSPVVVVRKEIIGLEDKNGAPHEPDRRAEMVDVAKKSTIGICDGSPKEPERPPSKSPKNLELKLSVDTPKKLKRLHFGASEQNSFKKRSSAHSPLDPLGPALRHFAVFKSASCDKRKVSTSSSDNSELDEVSDPKGSKGKRRGIPVVPIAFQSVDLGKSFASYCPQSEPVKRKIYSCSKTYDKLVKRFENEPIIFEEARNGQAGNAFHGQKSLKPMTYRGGLEGSLDGNQGVLPKERRKDRDKERSFPGGSPRRPPFGIRRFTTPEKARRPPYDADIFR